MMQIDNVPGGKSSTTTFAAQGAVREMIANGARFRVLRRAGQIPTFVYELPQSGDRLRCRALIRDAKARGGTYWAAFFAEIVLHEATPC